MRGLIISIGVLMMLAWMTAVSAEDYRYIPVEELKRFTADPIPPSVADLILVESGHSVDAVVFLLPAPFSRVREEVRKIVKERYGIVQDAEAVKSQYGALEDYPESFRKNVEAELRQLRAQHINVERFKLLNVVSGPYNAVKADAYSELHLRVVDGEDVFGKCCSLVVLYRLDHFMDWPRDNMLHTLLPVFPVRFRVSERWVTKSDVDLMENVKERLGLTYMPHFSSFENVVVAYSDTLERIRIEIDTRERLLGNCGK